MTRPQKLITHKGKTFYFNCARGTHSQCLNHNNKCVCKCHSDKKFTGSITSFRKEINKKARVKYALLTKQQLSDRNERVRYMRKTGRWKSN